MFLYSNDPVILLPTILFQNTASPPRCDLLKSKSILNGASWHQTLLVKKEWTVFLLGMYTLIIPLELLKRLPEEFHKKRLGSVSMQSIGSNLLYVVTQIESEIEVGLRSC